ncbi:hypothetical protein QFZ22_002074 [Streptomyces canus]|uniref:Uncharacterized protein n=1 Tax=Streptomyces canus TaxID=58343 RepID=A0AAW8F8P8_9ACTN|nr:hypothetical protein [Streptomyces canus]
MDTTPRWLDADEQRASMAYVAFSTLLGDYLNRRLRRDAETTHADYTLPAQLSSALDHALGMSEPARRLKITGSAGILMFRRSAGAPTSRRLSSGPRFPGGPVLGGGCRGGGSPVRRSGPAGRRGTR